MAEVAQRLCRECGEPSHREGRFVCLKCGAYNQINRENLGHDRARVVSLRELQRDRRHLTLVEPPQEQRPRTRGDCIDGPRPCPWVSCRHHLGLEVTRAGSLKPTFPDVEPDEVTTSCSLDMAERGEQSLEQIGALLNLTRERARQVFESAIQKMRAVGGGLKGLL